MTTDPGGPDRDETLTVVIPVLGTPISLTPMVATQILATQIVAAW
jgi:hypothetical protein